MRWGEMCVPPLYGKGTRLILGRTSAKYTLAVFKMSDAAGSQIISSSPQCTSHCRPSYPRSRWACWVLMNEPRIKLKYGKSRRGYRRNILPWELLESLMTNGTKRSAPPMDAAWVHGLASRMIPPRNFWSRRPRTRVWLADAVLSFASLFRT